MTRFLTLLAFVACAPDTDDTWVADADTDAESTWTGDVAPGVPLPPPGNLTLSADTLVAGDAATLTLGGGTSGDTAAFVLSTVGEGSGPCPPALGGLCLDVASPKVMGTTTVDVDGMASLTFTVPASKAGYTITFQGATGGSNPDTSALVVATICATDDDANGVCDEDEVDTGTPVDTSLDLPPVAEELQACTVDPVTDLGFTPTVTITEQGSNLRIEANGIPEHPVGSFPGNGSPHAIAEQTFDRRVPQTPSGVGQDISDDTDTYSFGVGTNGVIFSPYANEYWDNDSTSGWQYEPLGAGLLLGLDCNYAHVFPGGNYHYHGMPEGLMDQQGDGPDHYFVGYAADGYPIYARWGHDDPDDDTSPLRPLVSGWSLKEGTRPDGPGGDYDGTFVEDYEFTDTGDLDACNGRTAHTGEHGYTYHYVLTDSFPYVPRCWTAEPHRTWMPGSAGGTDTGDTGAP